MFSVAATVGLLPIAPVEEGETVQVCVQLSCVTCSDIDTGFGLDITLEIVSGTAGE